MEINDFINIRVQHTAIQVAHLFSPTQWSKGKPVSTLSSRTNTHPPGIQIGRFQKGKEELEQSYLETKTNSFKGSCLIFFLSFFLSPLPSPSLSPFLSFYLFIFLPHLQHMEVPRPGTESGSGSNPSWSCNLCDSCGNPRSLTHCARPGIEPVQLQRQCQIPNAQHNGKNSILLLFLFFLFSFLFFFCFFRAAPVAYGSPQTRG